VEVEWERDWERDVGVVIVSQMCGVAVDRKTDKARGITSIYQDHATTLQAISPASCPACQPDVERQRMSNSAPIQWTPVQPFIGQGSFVSAGH
jgi:hypothetical protein